MPLALRVQTQLDERSTTEVRDRAQSLFDSIGGEAGEAFLGGLNRGIGDSTTALAGVGRAATSMGGAVSSGAAIAAAGIAAIGVAAVRAGQEFYALGERFDSVFDNMAIQTGKIGSELDGLREAVKNVAGDTASSFEDIGDIAARLSQSFSSLSGQPLEDLTRQIADLNRMTGETLNVREFGQVIRGFGGDAQEATRALDDIYSASAATGIPLGELVSTLQNVGPSARSLGLDMSEAAGLIVTFEKSGVDSQRMLSGLSRAADTFSEHNINLKTGLADTITQIRGFIAAGNDAAAVKLAGDVFGTRNAQLFIDAIRQGRLTVDSLNAGLGNTQNSISNMEKATSDWAETWDKLKNRALGALEPIGTKVFEIMNSMGQLVLPLLPGGPTAPTGPSGPMPPGYTPSNPLDVLGGGGGTPSRPTPPGDFIPGMIPALPLPPPPGGYPGAPPPQDIAGALAEESGGSGAKVAVPYGPGFGEPPLPGESLEQWRQRQSLLEAQHGLAQANAELTALEQSGTAEENELVAARNRVFQARNRLTAAELAQTQQEQQAVQVAALPGQGAAPRLGQTAESYAKEQAALDASHKRLQAEAELAQVQQDANSTQEDLTKAQNALTQARQSEWQAVLRLNESTNDAASALEEVGAALDKDLGISKGLPGLADNLVRFLASLAAAPLQGQLAAIRDASSDPKEAGGLIGMAAVQGMFGPQYMSQTATTSYQMPGPYSGTTAGATPSGAAGYAGDQALLAGVPVGRYAQVQAADLTQGLGDCSSAVEDLVNMIDGVSTEGRSMSTHNADQWLQSRGFLPGVGGPGDFRVGFNSGHMQATLPGGTPFNWGSDESAAQRGIGGTGADDPAFTSHYYRPMGASSGAVPGRGSAAMRSAPFGSIPIPLPVTIVAGGNAEPLPVALPGMPGNRSTQGSSLWDAIAAKESSGDWANNNTGGHQTSSGAPRGGLQITDGTWRAFGGTEFAPTANLATKEQQIAIGERIAFSGYNGTPPQGLGAWEVVTKGLVPGVTANTPASAFHGAPPSPVATPPAVTPPPGPKGPQPLLDELHRQQTFDGPFPEFLPPGTTIAQNNTGQPQQVLPPGMPTIMAPNLPGGQGGPPPGPPKPEYGGTAPAAHAGGSAGAGGGLMGAAIGAGALAADMFAPGSGVAVQIAGQEIQRAIKQAGILTGIGVGGLMETFLPAGASDLAANSWITKIAGGFAGMAPQLPNIAGKATAAAGGLPGLANQATMSVAAPPAPGNTGASPAPQNTTNTGVHIENYNVVQSEDRAGQDLARWNMPGQR